MKSEKKLAVCLPFRRRNNPQIEAKPTRFDNATEPLNAKGRMNQQQSATPSNNLAALF